MRLYNLFRRLGGIGIAGLIFGLAGLSNVYAAAPAGGSPGSAEVCKGCHENQVNSYAASVHGQKGNLKGPASAGECSTCHGDGAAHIKAGGGRGVGGIIDLSSKSVPAKDRSAPCLACHEGNRTLAFWDSGKHKKNDVSCSSCHSIHGGNILKKAGPSISPYVTTSRQLQYETCASCHKDIGAQIRKPSRHPIIEGKLKCSDCHDPHGALSKASIKSESVNTLCTNCHADKRGPYIHEHPPVESNCLTCHDVHGSQHNKLLSQKMPNLCQDCHDWTRHPGTPYGAQRGFPPAGNTGRQFVARSCLSCHNLVHGSNASTAGRGQFFTR